MLLRLVYLGVTNTLALLRLLPMSERDKDAEILAYATKLPSCSGSGTARRSSSPHLTGRGWLLFYIGCRGTPFADCGYWCARRPCCAGIVT